MLTYALLDHQPVLLTPDNYHLLPVWRMAALQGKLRCPRCGAPLKLMAGISFEPYFLHPAESTCPLQTDAAFPEEQAVLAVQADLAASAEAAAAAEPVSAGPDTAAVSQSADREGRQLGSFRLPKNRPIGNGSSASLVSPSPLPVYRKRLTPRTRVKPAELFNRNEALHANQKKAVETTDGPLLILAGAGSGKTRVMTARTVHLIRHAGVAPRQIMVVTFTTKAAEEIRQRIARELPPRQAGELIAGTFHSIFFRMLLHHRPQQWDQRRLLKKEWQKWRLLRETGILAGHDELLQKKEHEVLEALAVVSRWKNEYILPHEAEGRHAANDAEELARKLYPLYEEAKKRQRCFDFDDMLIGCFEMLRDDPELLARYQERITHVMIDEFQDINRIQYETVKLLAAPQNNLCVIGDDDQSIYGFRGSNPHFILGFTRDYPEAKSITLEVNYRSRTSILGLSYSLIGHNQARWVKECRSFHREEGEAYLFESEDEEEQASRIIDDIMHRHNQGVSFGSFAILFRTSESARPILERLSEAGIPFHYTQEDDSFYQRQTVRWALAYLRLVLDPDDADALREILPTLYLPLEQWNAIRSQAILEDVPVLDVLPRLPQLKPFQRKQLDKQIEILRGCREASPARALEKIFADGKLRDYLRKRAKERESSRERWSDELQQLIAMSRRHAAIPDFLRYFQRMSEQEKEWRSKRPLPGEAVHVLSIHRAKGLEYDHVFLPDLVEGALPHEYTLEELRKGKNAALEEERRLLYVAITRARLNVSIGIPRERFGRKTRPSRFIAEMGR